VCPEGCERKALVTGISLYCGSVGQPVVGSSTGDFKIWLKGNLEVECLSLWELCEGNLEGGLLCWDPEGYLENALETGISFHGGSAKETWRRVRLPGTLKAG
jgi:hypothetical protein